MERGELVKEKIAELQRLLNRLSIHDPQTLLLVDLFITNTKEEVVAAQHRVVSTLYVGSSL